MRERCDSYLLNLGLLLCFLFVVILLLFPQLDGSNSFLIRNCGLWAKFPVMCRAQLVLSGVRRPCLWITGKTSRYAQLSLPKKDKTGHQCAPSVRTTFPVPAGLDLGGGTGRHHRRISPHVTRGNNEARNLMQSPPPGQGTLHTIPATPPTDPCEAKPVQPDLPVASEGPR